MLQAKAMLDQYIADSSSTKSSGAVRRHRDGAQRRSRPPGSRGDPRHRPTSAIIYVARLKPLRVFSYVPQSVTPFIRNGDAATITVTGYPGRKFTGSITRHPEALAPDSRTMLVEVDLPNDGSGALPGYVRDGGVHGLDSTGVPLVPDDALIFRDDKVYVPVVRNNRLHLAEVALGYDNGVAVQVTSGVDYNDLVALNVGQAARDGENVQPVQNTQ